MASKTGEFAPGIFVGPLHQGKNSARKTAKNLFRLLLSLGVRNTDIGKVSVEPEEGLAFIQLQSKEAEDFMVRACKDIREVLNFFDLRLLTTNPKQFKVIRRTSVRSPQKKEASVTISKMEKMTLQVPGASMTGKTGDREHSEKQLGESSEKPPGDSSEKPPGDSSETSPGESSEKPQGNTSEKSPGDSSEKPPGDSSETSPGDSSEKLPGDNLPMRSGCEVITNPIQRQKVPDPTTWTQSSIESSSSSTFQQEFEQLEEEPPLPIMLHASTSMSESHNTADKGQDGDPVVKVDVKTSTPHVSPCFCPETVFYHKRQHVGSENRHAEFKRGGNLNDLRAFRSVVGKYMCAFLNTEGGTIYFGVTDDGRAIGIKVCQKSEDMIRLTIDNAVTMIKPFVKTSEYSVNFAKVMEEDGSIAEDLKVLEVCVKPRNPSRQQFSFSDVAYVRRDGSLRAL